MSEKVAARFFLNGVELTDAIDSFEHRPAGAMSVTGLTGLSPGTWSEVREHRRAAGRGHRHRVRPEGEVVW